MSKDAAKVVRQIADLLLHTIPVQPVLAHGYEGLTTYTLGLILHGVAIESSTERR